MFFKKKLQISKDDILNITNNLFKNLEKEGVDISEKNIESLIISGDKISLIIIVSENLGDNIPKIKNFLTQAISSNYPKSQINIVFTALRDEANKNLGSSIKISTEKNSARKDVPKPPSPKAVPNVKKIIAVASGKGGVGKSTVAAHLAIAYAKQGLNVGLVDADIHGPSVAKIMGISQQPEIQNNMMIPIESNGVKCMSMGFLLGENAPAVWRGPMITKALGQLMLGANWGAGGKDIDVMVMDLPPGTGDIQLSMAQNFKIDGVILVTTPQEVALLDVRKAFSMFEKLNIPIKGIIENMAYFEDVSGNKNYIFGQGAVEKFCTEKNIKLLAKIPLNPEIAKGCDEGTSGDNIAISYLNGVFEL